MRETLYRGKREDTGEWVYGYYVATDDTHYIFTGDMGLSQASPAHCLMYRDFVRYEVVPKTIGQCTGFADKNGRRIFEGDVVRNSYGNDAKVCFDFGCFFIMRHYTTNYVKSIADNCEVIGNIHDAPELLERRI
jgi:uncharacterized phage protein (TIGR01671 family)